MTDTPNRRKDDARPAVPLQWGEQPDALQALRTRDELVNNIVRGAAQLLDMLGVGALQLPIPGTEPVQYVVAGTLSTIAAVLPAAPTQVSAPQADKLSDLWMDDDMTRDAAASAMNAPRKDLKEAHQKAIDDLLYWRRRALQGEAGAPRAGQEAQAVRGKPVYGDTPCAYAENGVLHWMTGRKFDNCELYTRPAAPSTSGAPAAPDEVSADTKRIDWLIDNHRWSLRWRIKNGAEQWQMADDGDSWGQWGGFRSVLDKAMRAYPGTTATGADSPKGDA